MRRAEPFVAYLFLLPAMGLLIVFRLLPAAAGFGESLFTSNLSRAERAFVGLENFARLLHDPIFWRSFRTTLFFSLIINPLQTALALALAVLANQRVRGIGLFRSLYLLPMVVSLNVHH